MDIKATGGARGVQRQVGGVDLGKHQARLLVSLYLSQTTVMEQMKYIKYKSREIFLEFVVAGQTFDKFRHEMSCKP